MYMCVYEYKCLYRYSLQSSILSGCDTFHVEMYAGPVGHTDTGYTSRGIPGHIFLSPARRFLGGKAPSPADRPTAGVCVGR